MQRKAKAYTKTAVWQHDAALSCCQSRYTEDAHLCGPWDDLGGVIVIGMVDQLDQV